MLTGLLLSASAPHGAQIRRGVSYAPGPRGKLDVYAPRGADGDAPMVVFFYGGAWRRGSRGRYGFVGQVLAQSGFVAVIADYRVFPKARFPDFVQDCAAATAWAKANAAAFGADPDKLFVMGHSAGAYNAAMLALDPRWLGAHGLHPLRDLKGVIGLAGLYDFGESQGASLREIFGADDGWDSAQPITHAHGAAPPLLLITGSADQTVDPGSTRRLAARIRALQGRVAELIYPGLGHIMAVGVLLPWLGFQASVLREVRRFVQLASLDGPAIEAGESPP